MGTRDQALDAEWLAFRSGLKPALRITIAADRAPALLERLAGLGGAIVRAHDVPVDGRRVDVLYVARSAPDAVALQRAEARALNGQRSAHRDLGIQLGFPPCCVEAFCRRIERGVDVLANGVRGNAEDYVAARDAWVERANPLLNCLLFRWHQRVISFYPCRFDCEPASAYARALLEVLDDADRRSCRDLVGMLARPIVIDASGARAIVTAADRAIVTAEAPSGPNGRDVDERDVSFAAGLVGRRVAVSGALDAAPSVRVPPWLLPFGD